MSAPQQTVSEQVAALRALRAPFPPEQIGKLPKRNKKEDGSWGPTVYLDYVGHADITARLLDVDPEWSWEPMATRDGLPLLDSDGNLWIRLTVCGISRIGVGDGKSAKERIGDALRNAAMRFGAALDLWAKGDREYAQHQVATAPAPPPPHLARLLQAVQGLNEKQKATLRTWYDGQGMPGDLRQCDEDQAHAVCEYAASLTAWPDTTGVDPHTAPVT